MSTIGRKSVLIVGSLCFGIKITKISSVLAVVINSALNVCYPLTIHQKPVKKLWKSIRKPLKRRNNLKILLLTPDVLNASHMHENIPDKI